MTPEEQSELLQALKELHRLTQVVWEYDGDVFGKHHNDAVDADAVAASLIQRAEERGA